MFKRSKCQTFKNALFQTYKFKSLKKYKIDNSKHVKIKKQKKHVLLISRFNISMFKKLKYYTVHI